MDQVVGKMFVKHFKKIQFEFVLEEKKLPKPGRNTNMKPGTMGFGLAQVLGERS